MQPFPSRQTSFEQDRAEIAFAGVGQDDDDGVPAFSGRWPSTAAATAAPLEMPDRMPSSCARRRAYSTVFVGHLLDRPPATYRGCPARSLRRGLDLCGRVSAARRRAAGWTGRRAARPQPGDGLALGALDIARHAGDRAAGADGDEISTLPSVSFRFPGRWFVRGWQGWQGS